MTSTTATPPITTTAAVHRLAERLAQLLRTYRGADEVFAPDADIDVNVPFWRFRLRGAEQLLAWLQGYAPHGYQITVTRVLPTAAGFVIELEGEYEHHGTPLFFRNIYVADAPDGLITGLAFWCTGDWDPETRDRYSATTTARR